MGAQGGLICGGEKEVLRVQVAHVLGHQLLVVRIVDRVLVVVEVFEHLQQGARLIAHERRGAVGVVRSRQGNADEEEQTEEGAGEAMDHGGMRGYRREFGTLERKLC